MSEDFETCPTDVAHAPAERVWERLINPSLLHWVDARLIEAPSHNLSAGERVIFAATLGLRVTWTVIALQAPREMTLDIALPFGMANRETILLSPIDAQSCRVTFN